MHPKLKEKFNVIVEVELSGLNPQVFVSNPESANMFGDILVSFSFFFFFFFFFSNFFFFFEHKVAK